jgi:hypothetical protein
MSWQEIDLVNLSEEAEEIPDGEYLFEILRGAKYGTFDKGKVEFGAKIAEGEFKGRVVYPSFPDPEKLPWSAQAFKKLERTLVKNGAPEIIEGQDPPTYLNQDDVVGKRFIAPISKREYTKQDGEVGKSLDLKFFKIKAVA